MTRRILFVCLWYFAYGSIETYRAAVLEHQAFHLYEAITNISMGEYVVNQNLDEIEKSIVEASNENVDIFILGEVALFGHNHNYSAAYYFFEELPKSNSGLIACNNSLFNNKPILQRLSCLSIEYKIYLAVHHGDNQLCNTSNNKCITDHYQWSTTAVFNKNGEIIAKYIKMHMVPDELQYDQLLINNTLTNDDLITFNLTLYDYHNNNNNSINITFGLLICYDRWYSRPLVSFIQENISNIIYSTSKGSGYAEYSNLAVMHKISQTFSVNVLGASTWWINNISNNTVTNLQPYGSGSGIFSSGNILNQYFNTDVKNIGDKLLIADIPININGPKQNLTKLTPYKILSEQPKLCNNYTKYALLGKAGLIINESVECNNNNVNFKCNVYAIINDIKLNTNDYWILHAYNGYIDKDANNVYYHTQFCSFYRCYNNGTENEMCSDDTAHIYDTNGTTIFNEIVLNANFMEKSVIFLTIFDDKGFIYKNINNKTKVGQYKNNNNQNIYSYFKNNTDKDVIINLSVEGKQYNLEGIYQ